MISAVREGAQGHFDSALAARGARGACARETRRGWLRATPRVQERPRVGRAATCSASPRETRYTCHADCSRDPAQRLAAVRACCRLGCVLESHGPSIRLRRAGTSRLLGSTRTSFWGLTAHVRVPHRAFRARHISVGASWRCAHERPGRHGAADFLPSLCRELLAIVGQFA